MAAALLRLWPAWRWAALLGFALLAPAALPAGGGERRLPEVRRRERGLDPLLTQACMSLRCAPEHQAPVLVQLDSGVPLRVLRHWLSPAGRPWLRVETISGVGEAARGWLPG